VGWRVFIPCRAHRGGDLSHTQACGVRHRASGGIERRPHLLEVEGGRWKVEGVGRRASRWFLYMNPSSINFQLGSHSLLSSVVDKKRRAVSVM